MTGFISKRAMSRAFDFDRPAEPNIKVLSKSIVDGDQWYTVSCQRDTSKWLRETYRAQENKLWFQSIDSRWNVNFNVFDIHEKIYTILLLKG